MTVPVVQYWQVLYSCLSCSCYKESGLPHIFFYYNFLSECVKMISTCFFDRRCHVILYTLTALYGHVKGTSQTCGFSHHHHLLFGCLHLFMYTLHHSRKTRFCVLLIFLSSTEPAIWYFYTLLHICSITALLIQEVINLATFFCDTCTLQKHMCNKYVFSGHSDLLYVRKSTQVG